MFGPFGSSWREGFLQGKVIPLGQQKFLLYPRMTLAAECRFRDREEVWGAVPASWIRLHLREVAKSPSIAS